MLFFAEILEKWQKTENQNVLGLVAVDNLHKENQYYTYHFTDTSLVWISLAIGATRQVGYFETP